MQACSRTHAATGRGHDLDIADPGADLVSIARGFGAAASRVDRLEEVGDAVSAALAAARPALLDVQVAAPLIGCADPGRRAQSNVCSVSPDISYMRRTCRATPIRSAAAASPVKPPSIRSSFVTR